MNQSDFVVLCFIIGGFISNFIYSHLTKNMILNLKKNMIFNPKKNMDIKKEFKKDLCSLFGVLIYILIYYVLWFFISLVICVFFAKILSYINSELCYILQDGYRIINNISNQK